MARAQGRRSGRAQQRRAPEEAGLTPRWDALPDGRLLSSSCDRSRKVWGEAPLSVRGGAGSNVCAATLQGHTGWVTALAVLPDRRVVSGSADGTLRVWQ